MSVPFASCSILPDSYTPISSTPTSYFSSFSFSLLLTSDDNIPPPPFLFSCYNTAILAILKSTLSSTPQLFSSSGLFATSFSYTNLSTPSIAVIVSPLFFQTQLTNPMTSNATLDIYLNYQGTSSTCYSTSWTSDNTDATISSFQVPQWDFTSGEISSTTATISSLTVNTMLNVGYILSQATLDSYTYLKSGNYAQNTHCTGPGYCQQNYNYLQTTNGGDKPQNMNFPIFVSTTDLPSNTILSLFLDGNITNTHLTNGWNSSKPAFLQNQWGQITTCDNACPSNTQRPPRKQGNFIKYTTQTTPSVTTLPGYWKNLNKKNSVSYLPTFRNLSLYITKPAHSTLNTKFPSTVYSQIPQNYLAQTTPSNLQFPSSVSVPSQNTQTNQFLGMMYGSLNGYTPIGNSPNLQYPILITICTNPNS